MSNSVENRIRRFYDEEGWTQDDAGRLKDTASWGHTKAGYREFSLVMTERIAAMFSEGGDFFLNCGCGPFTASAMAYSASCERRICADLSMRALQLCREKFGDDGVYVCTSMVGLGLKDDVSDGTLCEHALYHVDQALQEAAVRHMIRVTKPGKPLVIIYSNPLSPVNIMEGLYRWSRLNRLHGGGNLYFFRYRLKWWRKFEDSCEVEIRAFDPISARQAKILLPTAAFSRLFFRWCGWLGERYPRVAKHLWAYPVIILKKRRSKIL